MVICVVVGALEDGGVQQHVLAIGEQIGRVGFGRVGFGPALDPLGDAVAGEQRVRPGAAEVGVDTAETFQAVVTFAAVEEVRGLASDHGVVPGPAATSSTSAWTLSSSPGSPSSRTSFSVIVCPAEFE